MDNKQQCGRCRGWVALEDFSPSYRGKKGTWCRACFAEYARHKKHGTTPPPAKPPTVDPRACLQCGLQFVPAQDKPAVYCSRACKERHRYDLAIEERREAKPDRVCQWCGVALTKSQRSDAVFCSAECNERAHCRTRAYRRRGGTGAKPRKQPLVNLAALAQRDGSRCSLCGKRLDLTLKYPDPMFATVDHVVPLAHGGDPLDPANCRVVHLRCNVSRQHRGGDEQLRLIG